jgi:hypothetical protein
MARWSPGIGSLGKGQFFVDFEDQFFAGLGEDCHRFPASPVPLQLTPRLDHAWVGWWRESVGSDEYETPAAVAAVPETTGLTLSRVAGEVAALSGEHIT